MGRIEGIEKPLWHLDACVGGEKDGKGRQDSEDGPVDGVSGDFHTEGILHLSAPQGRQPEEHIDSRPQDGSVSAQIENEHQHDAVGRVIKIDKASQQE